MAANQTNDRQEISILNMQQVQIAFEGLKAEVNKLCKCGEYDIDTFQKVAINLSVMQRAIETLDKCQTTLVTIAKNNTITNINNSGQSESNVFDPNNLTRSDGSYVNQKILETD